MQQISTLILMFLLSFSVVAQKSGDQYKAEGKLDSALLVYGMQYMQNPTNADNTYKLAAILALMYQVDTACYFLEQALANNSSLRPLTNPDFYALTSSSRWERIENLQLEKYQAKHGELKNPIYAKKLLRMIMQDQSLDYYIDLAKSDFMQKGYAPHWYYPLGAYKQHIGATNFTKMEILIKEYGWPTYSMVGDLAADAPLLIINHHENPEIRKAYIKQVETACRSGEGSCMEYAKIQDRILVEENKPQIYGMQFRYNEKRVIEPFPIENPEMVDQRRKEIGLGPLKDYLKRKINYDWTVPQK